MPSADVVPEGLLDAFIDAKATALALLSRLHAGVATDGTACVVSDASSSSSSYFSPLAVWSSTGRSANAFAAAAAFFAAPDPSAVPLVKREQWVFFKDDLSKWERVVIWTLLVIAVVQYIYWMAKMANVLRAIRTTRCFTEPPLEGGTIAEGEEPTVTIQVCAYNEENVIEATIDAACQVDWPRDKLVIQVLDDSTDATSDVIERRVNYWLSKGVDCSHLTRPGRLGYKAGALHHNFRNIKGNFVAYFDSDHRCEANYLRRAIPQFFCRDGTPRDDVGLVQTPWASYNTHQNLLTEYDALSIDAHHVLEQTGRAGSLHCFGFNGTGGVWRAEAIRKAGNWTWETVTEDLDLSYLAHMLGYKFVFLRDVPQLLELPANVPAHRQQKNRWTKGFWQVLRKSLPRVLGSESLSSWIKVEFFMHCTAALSYVLAFCTILLLPIPSYYLSLTLLDIMFIVMPGLLAMIPLIFGIYFKIPGSNGHYKDWRSKTGRLVYLPVFAIMALGMMIYETRAILEGLLSNDATFLRTPKEGSTKNSKKKISYCISRSPSIEQLDNLLMATFGILVSFYVSIMSLVFFQRATHAQEFFLSLLFALPGIGLFYFHGTMFKSSINCEIVE